MYVCVVLCGWLYLLSLLAIIGISNTTTSWQLSTRLWCSAFVAVVLWVGCVADVKHVLILV